MKEQQQHRSYCYYYCKGNGPHHLEGARQSLRGRRGNHTPPHRGASGCSGAVTSRCHASTRRVNMRGFIILHIHPLELQLPKVTSCGDRSTSNVVSPRLQTRHRVARGATTYLHTSLALAATHESRRQPPPTLTSEWHSWLLRFGDTLQSELVASVASSGADGREPSCGQPRGQWRRRHSDCPQTPAARRSWVRWCCLAAPRHAVAHHSCEHTAPQTCSARTGGESNAQRSHTHGSNAAYLLRTMSSGVVPEPFSALPAFA